MDKLIYRTSWKDDQIRNDDYLELNHNEGCDSGIFDLLQSFINTLSPSIIRKYPDTRVAYEALSKFGLDPDKVLLTNGAEGAIRSILERNSNLESITFPDPTYQMLAVFAQIYKLNATRLPYKEDFTFDARATDIAYVANPDNCTGSLITLDAIETLCKTCKLVIIDETYYAFNGLTAIGLIDTYANLYIVRSFSKSHSIAGIRLGMVISNEGNISKLTEYKSSDDINAIACEYLKFIKPDDIGQSIHRLRGGKSLIEQNLRINGYKVKDTYANFILVEYDDKLYTNISRVARVKVITIADEKYIRITTVDGSTAERLIDANLFQ